MSDILSQSILVNDSKSVINFKRFYQSCTNQTDTEFNSDKYFIDYMINIFNQWPMLKNLKFNSINRKMNSNSIFGLEKYVAKLIVIRMPLLFRFESIEQNKKMLMKLTGTEDFCIMQNYLPKTEESKHNFIKLIKKLINEFNESIQTKEPLNSIELDQQINDLLDFLKHLYLQQDFKYQCGMIPKSNSKILQMTLNELNQNFTDQSNNQQFNFSLFIEYLDKESTVKFNPKSRIIISNLFYRNRFK